jgi:hypothetical protein
VPGQTRRTAVETVRKVSFPSAAAQAAINQFRDVAGAALTIWSSRA